MLTNQRQAERVMVLPTALFVSEACTKLLKEEFNVKSKAGKEFVRVVAYLLGPLHVSPGLSQLFQEKTKHHHLQHLSEYLVW